MKKKSLQQTCKCMEIPILWWFIIAIGEINSSSGELYRACRNGTETPIEKRTTPLKMFHISFGWANVRTTWGMKRNQNTNI